MTVKSIKIEPSEIKMSGKAQGSAPVGKNFDAFLGAADAMAPMNEAIMYGTTGSDTAAAVLHGAFTGMSGAAGAYGYGPAKAGGGGYGGYGGYGALSEYPGMMGFGGASTTGGYATGGGYKAIDSGMGGTGGQVQGLPTQELLNTMNMNNLKLLELQAMMQSNMQQWNTKSNILSADHRARLSMIEKFTARG